MGETAGLALTAFPSLLEAGEFVRVDAPAGQRWTAMDLTGRLWFDGLPETDASGIRFNTEGWPSGTVVLVNQENGQHGRVVIR